MHPIACEAAQAGGPALIVNDLALSAGAPGAARRPEPLVLGRRFWYN